MNELAGKRAPKEILFDFEKLIEAYYTNKPDINIHSQKLVLEHLDIEEVLQNQVLMKSIF